MAPRIFYFKSSGRGSVRVSGFRVLNVRPVQHKEGRSLSWIDLCTISLQDLSFGRRIGQAFALDLNFFSCHVDVASGSCLGTC